MRVILIIERLQKRLALVQDVDRGIDERRTIHSRAPTNGMLRR